MSKSIKITLASIFTAFSLAGCMEYEPSFHDGSGAAWIEEQLQKGYLTEQDVNILLEQEANILLEQEIKKDMEQEQK